MKIRKILKFLSTKPNFVKGMIQLPDSANTAAHSSEIHKEEKILVNSKGNTPWRTFSIFISSTFADMQAERDHLKNVVFPAVEEELHKRRIKLEIVDLRWGVDTTSMEQEDEREANVLKVCLDEIKRCRPFFIGLLGDRYGWVPTEQRMKDALASEAHLKLEKGKSVTDLEIEFGVLANRKQLVRSSFYFREPLPYDQFPAPRAALFSDQHNPILSDIEKADRKNALKTLKSKINHYFELIQQPEKVKTYTVAWDAVNEKVTALKTFGKLVFEDILADCESYAAETWNQVPQNWQEQELALLDAFIERNTDAFCGRKPLLETLKKHLLTDDTTSWGLVLTGESGSGKSAVFSMVIKIMHQENCFVVAHSAGISPHSKKVADLLQIWNRQLADHLGIKKDFEDVTEDAENLTSRLTGEQEKETTTPIEKLQKKFLELLQLVSANKRVVLLIDALDRFEPTARAQHLSWLPMVMPANVRMLCTAITGTEQNAVQFHKGLTAKSIDSFSTVEAKEMLDALCLRQHKILPSKIEKIILEKKRADRQPATSSPLWLSLTVNMLMAIDHDDFEKMSQLEGRGDQQIETYLSNLAMGFDPLPGKLFLSLIDKAGMLFGETFTKAIFEHIAISRNGLREKDLEKLLPVGDIAWDALRFANLRRWFKAHLLLQGEELQWNLVHSILKSALIQNTEEQQRVRLQENIAEYLLPLHNDPLKATETIYHLVNAAKYKAAALYYSSDLTDEEAAGATMVLTEITTADKKGLDLVSKLPGLVLNEFDYFHGILNRFIYKLIVCLEVEGNLNERLIILEKLIENLGNNFRDKITDESFVYDTAAIYVKLGSIHQSMGAMEEAVKYFKNTLALTKEFYEANPRSESLKKGLAISYLKLGDIHQSMGQMQEALKYFDLSSKLFKELYEANPRSESLKNDLASSYQYLGIIKQSMGHMEEALKYYLEFNRLCYELYDANPRSESLKNGLAISFDKLGFIHQSMGHMGEALKYFEEYNRLSKNLYDANPRREKLKNGLAISYERLGDIHQSMGHLEDAIQYFDNEVILFIELYEANPLSESLKYGLAISYERLGSIHQSMGHMKEALKYFEEYNKLTKELHESNLRSEELKKNLAISYGRLGSIHKSMGHLEESLQYNLEFNSLMKELYEANPQSEVMKNGFANSYGMTVDLYLKMGNLDEGVKNSQKAKDLFKELYEANPQSEELKNGFAISYEKLGDIHQSMGHLEEALKYFENYNQLSKELYEANPRSEEMKNGLAISYSKLGDIQQSMGHMEEALKYFENFSQLSKELYEANPRREKLKNDLAISYERLGDIHQSMGHLEKALRYVELFNRLIKELYKANPLSESPKIHLAISYQNLGNIYQSMGFLEEALKYFEELNRLMKELFEGNPRSEELKKGLAISYSKLGDIQQSMGHMEEALKYFENDLALSKELYEANPLSFELFLGLGISYLRIATILKNNELKKSATNFTASLHIFNDCFHRTQIEQYEHLRDSCALELDNIIDEFFRKYNQELNESNYQEAFNYLVEAENISENKNEIAPDINSIWMLANIKESLVGFKNVIAERIILLEYAINLRQNVLQSIDDEESLKSVIPVIVSSYGQLSWFYLFESEPLESESSARNAIELARKNKLDESLFTYIYTNWAHAILFQGKYIESKQIYLEWKDKPYSQDESKTFKDVFCEDLDELEKAGITHPDVAKIRKLITE